MLKYIILDFGNVLVTPTTGDWDMTPKFHELIDFDYLDMDKYQKARKENQILLSEDLFTLEQEYDMFYRFYRNILKECYDLFTDQIAKDIAHDRTYNDTKYEICPDIHHELEFLKNKYQLILLTDNWPCVMPYLDHYDLTKYFEKIYISSEYGSTKKEGTFFDYAINDFHIKEGEAIFIDDTEINLDVAVTKGLSVYLMDRNNSVHESKYKIIHNLERDLINEI